MQYCDGFCHPSHESAIGIHVSPPPEPHFPPHRIPPGCRRALALVPCVIHQTLTGYLFHVGNVYVSMLSLKSSHPLLLPLSPKVSSLCLPAWECYAAMKRREVLARAAAQMNQEDVVLSERSQTQQDGVAESHFCAVPEFVRFAETEDTTVAAQGGWGDGWRIRV